MRRRLAALLLPVAAALVVLAAAAGASSPSVTITTPKNGSTVTLHTTPYLAIAGNASFAPSGATDTTFYLRRDACGTSSDYPHLSTTPGSADNNPDGGDGCGLLFNAVVGLGGDAAPQAAFIDFPSSDGLPFAFDASRPVTGQISLSGFELGAAQVDVDLEALVGGEAVTLAQGTSDLTVLDPTATSSPVPFSVQPDARYSGADIQAMDLRVTVHGPNIYSGFIALNGASYVHIPSYAASVNKAVQVSLDDSTFANPVPARISGSTYSVAVPTPAVGKHTVYVRSTQGYATSATASSTFTVKR